MEVEVRTCKVYMWKAGWAVAGLHLLTCMVMVSVHCLCGWGENRKGRVPCSYSLGLSFPILI